MRATVRYRCVDGGGFGSGQSEKTAIRPPDPPDISWLKEGDYEETETVEEVPRALVLMAGVRHVILSSPISKNSATRWNWGNRPRVG